VFTVALLAGIVLLFAFIVIPYNTFGEDVKMLKDSGLTLIKVLALLVVVWTASVAVADEIEGRTALTVLSKPLTRRQFVVGKFVGLGLVALLVFMILGGVLLATTSLKVVYDAREGAKVDPLWSDCAAEMITVVPGLVLALLETVLLAAVSLAVSLHGLRARPSGADDRAVERGEVRDRAVRGQAVRHAPAGAGALHDRRGGSRRRAGAVDLPRVGGGLRRALLGDRPAGRPRPLPGPRPRLTAVDA
jgi:hypothetical protein